MGLEECLLFVFFLGEFFFYGARNCVDGDEQKFKRAEQETFTLPWLHFVSFFHPLLSTQPSDLSLSL